MQKRYKRFKKEIWKFYLQEGRDLPWRKTRNPYHIVVSEIMLQQTQVSRVLLKYELFVRRFPTFETLASASPRDVLKVWQGLGYNRRAMHLHKLAKIVVRDYRGRMPSDCETLLGLPGIGEATAGSLAAFAFNKALPFIETNIRRTYIHFFFPRRKKVSDQAILQYVIATLDRKNPREWYWALMDYGAMLAKKGTNPNRRSVYYRRQTPFAGSMRQMRGKIIKALIINNSLTLHQLCRYTARGGKETVLALAELEREGFLYQQRGRFSIARTT